jgi:catechol 2,3-dioxygenase-like lactoylglutathione lyase family enzyme
MGYATLALCAARRMLSCMLHDYPLYTYIPCKDLARARRFYTEKVGLTGKDENGGVAFSFAGGTAAFLYVSQFAGTNKASLAFWKVKDLRGLVTALEKRGVTFERYDLPDVHWEGPIARAGKDLNAWFKDPDGNVLTLHQQG